MKLGFSKWGLSELFFFNADIDSKHKEMCMPDLCNHRMLIFLENCHHSLRNADAAESQRPCQSKTSPGAQRVYSLILLDCLDDKKTHFLVGCYQISLFTSAKTVS